MKVSQAIAYTAVGVERIEGLVAEQLNIAWRQAKRTYLRWRQRQMLFDLKLIQEDIATGPARREAVRAAIQSLSKQIRSLER